MQAVADAIALYSSIDCRASRALLLFILVSDLLPEQLGAELVHDNLDILLTWFHLAPDPDLTTLEGLQAREKNLSMR